MSDLNRELAEAQEEVQGVKTHLRDELPELFEFDVVIGNVNYSDAKNSVSVSVEPSSEARNQLSREFGGVSAQINGELEFEFRLQSSSENA